MSLRGHARLDVDPRDEARAVGPLVCFISLGDGSKPGDDVSKHIFLGRIFDI